MPYTLRERRALGQARQFNRDAWRGKGAGIGVYHRA
jgi:hypothetical protein